MLQSFSEVCLKELLITCAGGGKSRCFVNIVSYCSDISEGKDMSGLRHGMAVVFQCNRCLGTEKDSWNMVQILEVVYEKD